MEESSVVKFSLYILKMFGFCRSRLQPKINLQVFSWVLITIITFILAVIGLKDIESASDVMASKAEGILNTVQILCRIYALLYCSKYITKIFDNRKLLWNFSKFSKKGNQLQSIRHKITVYQWLYLIDAFVVVTLMFSYPVFVKKDLSVSPLATWTPKEPSYALTVFFYSQSVVMILATFFVIAFDNLFIAFLVETILQTKLLAYALTIPEDEEERFYMKLVHCLKYHAFLLRHAKCLEQILQVVCLAQNVIATGCICMELYIIAENLNNNDLIIRCSFFALTCALQIMFYCFLADAVTEEFHNLKFTLFGIGWENQSLNVSKCICFAMARTNKMFVLTAGNMIIMNRESFGVIMKTAVSFFTLLLTLNGKRRSALLVSNEVE